MADDFQRGAGRRDGSRASPYTDPEAGEPCWMPWFKEVTARGIGVKDGTVIPAAGGPAAGAPCLTTCTLQIEPGVPASDGDELVISAPDGTAKIDAMPEGQPATSAQQERACIISLRRRTERYDATLQAPQRSNP